MPAHLLPPGPICLNSAPRGSWLRGWTPSGSSGFVREHVVGGTRCEGWDPQAATRLCLLLQPALALASTCCFQHNRKRELIRPGLLRLQHGKSVVAAAPAVSTGPCKPREALAWANATGRGRPAPRGSSKKGLNHQRVGRQGSLFACSCAFRRRRGPPARPNCQQLRQRDWRVA